MLPVVMARLQMERRLKLRSSSWRWPEGLIGISMIVLARVSGSGFSVIFGCLGLLSIVLLRV